MDQIFAADFIILGTGSSLKNGAIKTDKNGKIIQIYQDQNLVPDHIQIKHYIGTLVPGFINAHCHLELSHMEGQIEPKTGLVSFIQTVMKKRNHTEETIIEAMLQADIAMQKNGIVAVGDHANTVKSLEIKQKSNLHYHTFVELLGLNPSMANLLYQEAITKRETFRKADLQADISPHAPYSVSRELFRLIKKQENIEKQPISIHNQESDEENKLFKNKNGKFLEFYKSIGFNYSEMPLYSSPSLTKMAQWLPSKRRIQLVHNTFTGLKEISIMRRMGFDAFWCLCPNANIYIENTLPNLQYLQENSLKLTIGTDSLASNHQLCILSELKTLHQNFPNLSLSESVKWATLNGAKFLGIDEKFGSFEINKTPGIVLIEKTENGNLTSESTCKRLI